MAHFVAPLSKSLLCNLAPRSSATSGKKTSSGESGVTTPLDKHKAKVFVKGKVGLSVDDQASTLLMKATGQVMLCCN